MKIHNYFTNHHCSWIGGTAELITLCVLKVRRTHSEHRGPCVCSLRSYYSGLFKTIFTWPFKRSELWKKRLLPLFWRTPSIARTLCKRCCLFCVMYLDGVARFVSVSLPFVQSESCLLPGAFPLTRMKNVSAFGGRNQSVLPCIPKDPTQQNSCATIDNVMSSVGGRMLECSKYRI